MNAFLSPIQILQDLNKVSKGCRLFPDKERRCSWRLNRRSCSLRLMGSCARREFLAALVATLLGVHTSWLRGDSCKGGRLEAAEIVKGTLPAFGAEESASPVADTVYVATNAGAGVRFRYPSSWRLRTKPIKTHAFEILVVSDADPSTSIGVVSDAVRIGRIEDFGTANDIGERVIALERKKDGVLSAELVRAIQYPVKDSNPPTYYLCEYRVNSTRGGERHYAAKVTITGKQLYVMTVQSKENQWRFYEPLFRDVLESFEIEPAQL